MRVVRSQGNSRVHVWRWPKSGERRSTCESWRCDGSFSFVSFCFVSLRGPQALTALMSQALMLVCDKNVSLTLTGVGDVIEPADDGIIGV